nr:PREDICTED: coxsackievirus and adenovirus receptor-like [Lepisosteus oculatus]XP_015192895.1 PREDICTED: coxsackievirus and adenovirus receptor-like [Lepisosteus oculatus]
MALGMYLSLFLCLLNGLLQAAGRGSLLNIEGRAGGTAVLLCLYNLTALDNRTGNLDIEWTVRNTANISDPVIWFSGNQVFKLVPSFSTRISFSSDNQTTGDASVKIISLRTEDSGLYQCQVKKVPFIQKTTINMTVLEDQRMTEEAPSKYIFTSVPLLLLLILVPLGIWCFRRKCASEERKVEGSSSVLKENEVYESVDMQRRLK